jgi:hypothetical protein
MIHFVRHVFFNQRHARAHHLRHLWWMLNFEDESGGSSKFSNGIDRHKLPLVCKRNMNIECKTSIKRKSPNIL